MHMTKEEIDKFISETESELVEMDAQITKLSAMIDGLVGLVPGSDLAQTREMMDTMLGLRGQLVNALATAKELNQ